MVRGQAPRRAPGSETLDDLHGVSALESRDNSVF